MSSQGISFVILLIFCLKYSASSDECDNGKFYSDPENCERFFQCSNGVLYEMNCPGGLHFNPNSETCDYASDNSCEIQTTTITSVTTAEVTVLTEDDGGICNRCNNS